ncbi:hypothetical protein CIHG_04396 [Coccidioides immitis H538.4]|uniref:Uncharacterized protein n=3 Tax=Coccidioides immitis TaxID=5501 RepID=A0A0J8R8P6_COCIT|nr:hypothetical protein CIRG_09330 [Coccidioides immitis RMSCC 2394]KMU80098.1 hypothetical protein CISG_08440 [Coccidioides immitis RMSCC 3703]KMU86608.1 hypothetical protein CIHG_04396 [Coccidioides immitis H538.4]
MNVVLRCYVLPATTKPPTRAVCKFEEVMRPSPRLYEDDRQRCDGLARYTALGRGVELHQPLIIKGYFISIHVSCKGDATKRQENRHYQYVRSGFKSSSTWLRFEA